MIWECSRPNFLLSHAVESVVSSSLLVMFGLGVFPLGRLPVGGVNANREQVHCHRRLNVSVKMSPRNINQHVLCLKNKITQVREGLSFSGLAFSVQVLRDWLQL